MFNGERKKEKERWREGGGRERTGGNRREKEKERKIV